jgi:hypothetical protein
VESLPQTNEQRILKAVERTANAVEEIVRLIKEHADPKVFVEVHQQLKASRKGK